MRIARHIRGQDPCLVANPRCRWRFARGFWCAFGYAASMLRLVFLLMVQGVLVQGAAGQLVQALGRPGVEQSTVAEVVRMARDGIRRLAPRFEGTPARTIRIIVHKDAASMPEALRASLHPGVPGFARLGLDEIHIVMGEIKIDPPNDLRTTIDHELVHINK